MRIKSILFLLVCFSLSGLAMQAIACPYPDCGDCCYWVSTGPDPNDGYCDLIIGLSCGDCSGCSPCNSCMLCFCIWDCNPGATCCNGSCCNSGNCCNSTTCCPNYDDVCCTDSGSYCCDSGKTCCQGSCCASNQCCLNGTCVDKCTNTGQCNYGVLPGGPYADCGNTDPTQGSCAEVVEGAVCNHRAIIATNSAECADCESNCDKTRISACIEILPFKCRTHCFLLICSCTCDSDWDNVNYRGNHYECD